MALMLGGCFLQSYPNTQSSQEEAELDQILELLALLMAWRIILGRFPWHGD